MRIQMSRKQPMNQRMALKSIKKAILQYTEFRRRLRAFKRKYLNERIFKITHENRSNYEKPSNYTTLYRNLYKRVYRGKELIGKSKNNNNNRYSQFSQ